MRPRPHVSRRTTAVLRCVIAASLFVMVVLLHGTNVPRDAAHMVGWIMTTTTETIAASPQKTAASQSTPAGKTSAAATNDKGKAVRSALADTVMHLLDTFPPSGIDPAWGTDRFDSPAWHWGEPEPEPANATNLLRLDAHELTKMKRAHQGFVGALESRLPTYIPHRYDADDKNIVAAAVTPRQGLVTVGGGKYFVILAVSLRFLRRSGTTLPVEVFVTEAEYEREVCEVVLPRLNAVCRVYPRMVGADGNNKAIQGFQLKAFALLFSSFDEVLFLDADNTAMRDVAPLFASAPFRATGLVTWPDFWQTTVSPLYYAIASKDVEGSSAAAAPITARPSTESGQLLVDKARHWKTLLLAAYYNYYGPAFYYRLLNQGGTGMGDKETFLPAAAVFGLPAYQVHTPLERVGHRFEDNSTGSRVMLQYDAEDDWKATAALSETLANGGTPPASEEVWKALYGDVRALFLHLSWPKWDPTNLLGHVSKWSDMTMGVDGRPEPAFHHPPALAAQIRGTERMLWEEARWVACLRDRAGEHVFGHYRNNMQADRACERLRGHFERVFDGDTGKRIGLGPEDVLYPAMAETE